MMEMAQTHEELETSIHLAKMVKQLIKENKALQKEVEILKAQQSQLKDNQSIDAFSRKLEELYEINHLVANVLLKNGAIQK